jgi:uncharacterized protein involved in response to NO
MGFRPFFLLAAASTALVVPLWVLVFGGTLTLRSHLSPVAWHAHEMIFGFTGAVLAGFVLTAARTWTKLPTAHGAPLGALVALWLLGRGLSLAGAFVAAVARRGGQRGLPPPGRAWSWRGRSSGRGAGATRPSR